MSKNIVPCGGFELDDTLTIDKNGKLGVSDIVVFKTNDAKEITANMDISSIFDILEKSNNNVRFAFLLKEMNTGGVSCAFANSYKFGPVPDGDLICDILFTFIFATSVIQQFIVELDKEKNTATLLNDT